MVLSSEVSSPIPDTPSNTAEPALTSSPCRLRTIELDRPWVTKAHIRSTCSGGPGAGVTTWVAGLGTWRGLTHFVTSCVTQARTSLPRCTVLAAALPSRPSSEMLGGAASPPRQPGLWKGSTWASERAELVLQPSVLWPAQGSSATRDRAPPGVRARLQASLP